MDRDGTGAGFDCELTARRCGSVCDSRDRFRRRGQRAALRRGLSAGKADAALAASIFHFGVTIAIADLKQNCSARAFP